jgi:crotonobetainyl-CoA:carnitine CoA-transferase CaiB-like acyl-CoA transferase
MILADLGADTIKIEPLQGEGTRALLASDPDNSLDGMGAYFLTLNRNKKSVAIDLKSGPGMAVFKRLVEQSDIVLSNFGAGVPQRLGLDFETLSQVNPRIITCTVSGYGGDGPGADRPAFDQVAQAAGGGMSITGPDPEHPVRAGIPIGDLGGGMFGVMGILAALYERERSGVGQHVDIAMVDCQIAMLNYMATMHFLSGADPYPIGNAHFVHVPYDSFRCADGFIVIAVITDNFWQNLKQVIDCPEFDNPRYDHQPGRYEAREFISLRLNEILAANTCAHWLALLEAQRIPCSPVNSFSQALADPQVLHRKMVVQLRHPGGASTKGPGNPIKLSRTNEESYSPAPLLGSDTDAVLSKVLGMGANDIALLKAQGVIA